MPRGMRPSLGCLRKSITVRRMGIRCSITRMSIMRYHENTIAIIVADTAVRLTIHIMEGKDITGTITSITPMAAMAMRHPLSMMDRDIRCP